MTFVRVPAGRFRMGSRLSPAEVVARFGGTTELCADEHPRHDVSIGEPFWLSAHEVTVRDFRRFVEATSYVTEAEREGWAYAYQRGRATAVSGLSWHDPGFAQGDSHPVVCVSWNDAAAFCGWLSRFDGRRYGLPTEAEWEYAARGGTSGVFWWGDEVDRSGRVANVADAAHVRAGDAYSVMPMNDGHRHTAPVGNYCPNPLGLFDVIGNVCEWCGDGFVRYTEALRQDPRGPTDGVDRMLRGGSWYNVSYYCRCAYRFRLPAQARYTNVGFRVKMLDDRDGRSMP